jgi:hypothetical protein
LKGKLPANHSFHGGERLILISIGYFYKLKKHMLLCKDNHLCYQQKDQEQYFPVRIEIVFESNTS